MHISLSPLMYLKDFVLVLDYYILYEVAILNWVKPYNSIAHACSESQNYRTERANISSYPPSHLERGRGVGSGEWGVGGGEGGVGSKRRIKPTVKYQHQSLFGMTV